MTLRQPQGEGGEHKHTLAPGVKPRLSKRDCKALSPVTQETVTMLSESACDKGKLSFSMLGILLAGNRNMGLFQKTQSS